MKNLHIGLINVHERLFRAHWNVPRGDVRGPHGGLVRDHPREFRRDAPLAVGDALPRKLPPGLHVWWHWTGIASGPATVDEHLGQSSGLPPPIGPAGPKCSPLPKGCDPTTSHGSRLRPLLHQSPRQPFLLHR